MTGKNSNSNEKDYKDARLEYLEAVCKSQIHTLDLLTSFGDFNYAQQSKDPDFIFKHSCKYLKRMLDFDNLAFYKIQESDNDFAMEFCDLPSSQDCIKSEVAHAIQNGNFAWALKQNRAVVIKTNFTTGKLVLHVLATQSRIRGVFAGILSGENLHIEEHKLQSFSVIMHYTANALEGAELYELLKTQNQSLEETIQERTRELMEKAEELSKYAHELERSNCELENFAHLASHDLQEPLRKVIIFGDKLHEHFAGSLDEQGQNYLHRMQMASSRMQSLIDDLLDYSKIKISKGFILVNLGNVAQQAIDALDNRIKQANGKVMISALPTIEADPIQMGQIFQNIIGNALKFRKPDEPPVIKLLSSFNEESKKWEISIEDNGLGIDEKYSGRIFELFERLHGHADYEGTGMGLAICQKIVNLHGGKINVKSNSAQGATFVISLPEKQITKD